MKITCTEHEKSLLAEMRIGSGICLFDLKHCSKQKDCMECFEENIEWETTEERNENDR